MADEFDASTMPDEIRQLGPFRQLFESSGRSVSASILRGLFPMIMGVGLVIAAEQWVVAHNWKYYALCAVGGLMLVSGLRATVLAFRRRSQKIILFEKGFALWRSGVLTIHKWEQVERVDALEGFFGFTIVCQTDEGLTDKISFEKGIDPTQNLRELWRDVEEMSSLSRVPEIQRTINNGGEVSFVQKIWGKEVGTKVSVNQLGIRAKARYADPRFIFWRRVESVKADDSKFIITAQHESDPWLEESVLEMPGFPAIVAVSASARQTVMNTFGEIEKDRLPAAMKTVEAGQEFVLGDFGISMQGVRYKSDLVKWTDLFSLQIEFDYLAVKARDDAAYRRFEYGKLTLVDKLMLWSVADATREKVSPDSEDEEEDEENDGE